MSLNYRPEVDGLRAVAILPVVLFHAHLSAFSGGYVGVDVFFVISGYLITGLIAKEIAQSKFSIATFYERRIRRLFPALFFAMIGVSAIVTFWMFLPEDLVQFGRSAIGTSLFASNLLFWKEINYFNEAQDKVLLHTWSLAVEEQFYILFPLLLLLARKWARARLIQGVWLLAAISLLISEYVIRDHSARSAFYLLPMRAWELMIGSLIALSAIPPIPSAKLREIAGWVGLILIASAVFLFTETTDFPGLHALLPCVGAGLIIHATAGGADHDRELSRLAPSCRYRADFIFPVPVALAHTHLRALLADARFE